MNNEPTDDQSHELAQEICMRLREVEEMAERLMAMTHRKSSTRVYRTDIGNRFGYSETMSQSTGVTRTTSRSTSDAEGTSYSKGNSFSESYFSHSDSYTIPRGQQLIHKAIRSLSLEEQQELAQILRL